MASSSRLRLLLVLLSLAGVSLVAGAGELVTYWGQNAAEGGLADTCATGLYNIIMVAFVAVFGFGLPPQLDLDDHCSPEQGGCTNLTSDIEACQSMGVKVFISLGGGDGFYGLENEEQARSVADYVWNNYLGGKSEARPLGSAVLNGVDLDIEASQSPYWVNLVTYLKAHSSAVLLSSAPQCPFPDAYMGPGPGTALQTGLFDYVWPQFYNNYCDYQSAGTAGLLHAWAPWANASAIPGSPRIFMGLPATPAAAPAGGYLPSNVFLSQVLPTVKKSPRYGGVMLWSRYYDELGHFGAAIKSSL